MNRLTYLLWINWLGVMLAGFILTGCLGPNQAAIRGAIEFRNLQPATQASKLDKPTALELEARLMGFADRYLAKSAEATDTYQRAIKTQAARELGMSTFIFPGLAVIGIAAGGDPAADFLDMVVFTTLQREVLDSGWAREILGAHADDLLNSQRNLERQIWALAAEMLTPSQQQALRGIIAAWRKANPDQRYVSNVRFDDVAVVRGQDQGANALPHSEGLLAPLDEAVRETAELRLMAHRGIYLMQRMPPLLMAQARYLVHEEISPEQVNGLLKDISGFRQSVDEAQKTVAGLPVVVSRERSALFREWDQRQTGVSALLNQVAATAEDGKRMTHDIARTMDTLQQVVTLYPKSGVVLNETLARYHELLLTMQQEPPSDLGPKIELLRAIANVGEQLNRLASKAEQWPADQIGPMLNTTSIALLDALMWRGLGFLTGFFVLLLAYRLLCRRYLN